MIQRDVRGELAKRLRRQEVPDPVWAQLEEGDYVEAAITGGAVQFGDLVKEAQRLLRFSREQASWDRRHKMQGAPRPIATDLGDYVAARARVRDQALALKAGRAREVRAFRERMLDGAPISVPLARRLLASEAARVWPAREFERRGIPIVGHRGTETSRGQAVEDGRIKETIEFTVSWNDQELETGVSLSRGPGFEPDAPVLHFVDQHGEVFHTKVWPRSVLDRLREVSTWLATFYGFDAAQAAWFLLTDTPPCRRPLAGTVSITAYPTHDDGRVMLEIDPWVPADVVLRAYREVQRDLLGRENRPLSLRNLAAYETVLAGAREAARADPGGPSPTTARAMARWNAEHPDDPYRQEWQFARDVDRAERAVLFPNYRIGEEGEDEGTGP